MVALSIVLVAPMTKKWCEFPCRVECDFDGKKGLIFLDQVRAVDKLRLVKKIGVVGNNTQVK